MSLALKHQTVHLTLPVEIVNRPDASKALLPGEAQLGNYHMPVCCGCANTTLMLTDKRIVIMESKVCSPAATKCFHMLATNFIGAHMSLDHGCCPLQETWAEHSCSTLKRADNDFRAAAAVKLI